MRAARCSQGTGSLDELNSEIREATADDVAACAEVVNGWIDATDWISRVHPPEVIEGFIADAFPERRIFVIGNPIRGYLSLNPENAQIGALYTRHPGRRDGKALLERVKDGRNFLQLWTHEPNLAAQRFYQREGFTFVDRNPEGGDGLPELRMEWHR